MIKSWASNVIAQLADGRTVRWKDGRLIKPIDALQGNNALTTLPNGLTVRHGGTKPISNTESVIAIKTCPRRKIVLMLTHDHHILLESEASRGLVDITSLVHMLLNVPKADAEYSIKELRVAGETAVARSEHRICAIIITGYAASNGKLVADTHTYSLQSPITKFGCCYGRGYVVTEDNKLSMIGNDVYYEDNTMRNSPHISSPIEIDFANVAGIREIICGYVFGLLLMNDGSVYARGLGPRTGEVCNKPFSQVLFPYSDSITKIVTDGTKIIYITLEGTCYYTDIRVRPYPGASDSLCLHPSPLQSLYGRFVTGAFILDHFIVFQYDTDKLCLMYLYTQAYPVESQLAFSYQTGAMSPIDIPFYDDKGIVSIVQADGFVYFTTSEGYVYQTESGFIHCDHSMVRVPFFDENPVAVSDAASTIPSALSVLD